MTRVKEQKIDTSDTHISSCSLIELDNCYQLLLSCHEVAFPAASTLQLLLSEASRQADLNNKTVVAETELETESFL